MKTRIAILGSTGSVGTQTLAVVEQCPERFDVVGLTTNGRLDLLMPAAPTDGPASEAPSASRLRTVEELRQLERENFIAVLNHLRWKIAGPGGAAEFLGLHPATLASRLKAMSIERPRTSGG